MKKTGYNWQNIFLRAAHNKSRIKHFNEKKEAPKADLRFLGAGIDVETIILSNTRYGRSCYEGQQNGGKRCQETQERVQELKYHRQKKQ